MPKQHVDLARKLRLRRRLCSDLDVSSGAAYVPFIGDGDIAVELYQDFRIFGADLDRARVEVASSRLPDASIVWFNCDHWPFPNEATPFTLADFDAYAYPYDAFRAFWSNATKADRLGLVFTDGVRQAAHMRMQNRNKRLTMPDGSVDEAPEGERVSRAEKTRMRRLYNFWYKRHVRPWFDAFVEADGWRVSSSKKYLRGDMLYWSAILDRAG